MVVLMVLSQSSTEKMKTFIVLYNKKNLQYTRACSGKQMLLNYTQGKCNIVM